MKAPRFDYERPGSLSEGVALLQRSGNSAKPLAGGQSLVPMMNLGLIAPNMIVDLSGLHDLTRVQEEDNHLFIGHGYPCRERRRPDCRIRRSAC